MNKVYNSNWSYDHSQVEPLLAGIKREASSIDLYSRLVNAAPNQKHKNHILYALEGKKVHLRQFTDLYITLTGRQPDYQIDKVIFRGYKDGLVKAYQAEAKGYQEYHKECLRNQDPYIHNVFSQALNEKKDSAARLDWLYKEARTEIKDYGRQPFVIDINEAAKQNNTYRTALWTGEHLQVTLMSIDVGDDIGLEVHPTTDQFLRIEEGHGIVQMGDSQNHLNFVAEAFDDYAIMIPAGKWHNVTNIGDKPLKLYAIYAPPEHPFGTVHRTKAEAMAAERSI
ncbi:cupin domain-containing protein [Bacillus sp. NEB1478]|uniref:cupin domain-containing protein n=1 Tax=Bacillus sp. NEB1478 TaxID=3073816 RepID=UPI0028731CED|nr:cupin domain-containing protein [Bacillus sp. NEB1478]WNB90970.1 cupin domain-containing protein [Bacillus sp. NEB1478]